MIIDTHNKETLENSICAYFQITKEELYDFIIQIHLSPYSIDDMISEYVSDNISTSLDFIQFYHLTRRLHGANLKKSNNLYDLLLDKTIVSEFLINYGLTFRMEDDHLQLYENGIRFEFDDKLDEKSENDIAYIKWRMGYNKDDIDYCVNGFAFRHMLENNSYYNELRHGPEFISKLSQIIGKKEIIEDYYKNSDYYCLEYKIPIDKVIIDENDKIVSKKDKTKLLLEGSLLKLYNIWGNPYYWHDLNNINLRLRDEDIMQEDFLVMAEKIID